MKRTLLILLLLSFSTTGAFAFGGDKEKKGNKGKFKEILKQLELTDEQKEKLKTIRKKNKGKYKFKKGEMKELHQKLQDGFSGSANEAELEGLHTKIKQLRIKKMDKRFNRMMNIRSVLDENQRKKFFDYHQRMRKNRRGR